MPHFQMLVRFACGVGICAGWSHRGLAAVMNSLRRMWIKKARRHAGKIARVFSSVLAADLR